MAEIVWCPARGCDNRVVLCPGFCSVHWWKLPYRWRHTLTRSEQVSQASGNHPTDTYRVALLDARGILDATQGTLTVYVREPDDQSTRHTRLTNCERCKKPTVHHGLLRERDTFLVCEECSTMIPSVPHGIQPLPGMEVFN